MSSDRLMRALETGQLSFPDNATVGAWNAPDDLRLPVDHTIVSQAFRPSHDLLSARGFRVSPTPDTPVAASIVFCHRSKDATLDLLAQALKLTQPGGLIALDGAKTDGIDSHIKALRAAGFELETYAKSHGKIVWFTRSEGQARDDWLSDWITLPNGDVTWPGIFSSDGIDTGSQLLVDALPPLTGHVADFGAGWGYLSKSVLRNSADISQIDLYEADYHACDAARRNLGDDARAFVHWADVSRLDTAFDAIITNPPFHIGRKPDPTIGQAFIEAAGRCLKPRGVLWMVANRTLPYEAMLDSLFRKSETIASSTGFKILRAEGPLGPKSRSRQREQSSLS